MAIIDIVKLALPWVLTALALMTFGLALWSFNWPSVKGRIDISIFDQEVNWETSSTSGGTSVNRTKTDKLHLSYSYSVNGVTYHGSRISPFAEFSWHLSMGGDSSAWSKARDNAKWYRESASPDVYFCPFYPRWACLEPGGLLCALVLGTAAGMAFWLL